jgi:hypothetical protein
VRPIADSRHAPMHVRRLQRRLELVTPERTAQAGG